MVETKDLAEVFKVNGVSYGALITQRPLRYFKTNSKNEWVEISEEEYTNAQWADNTQKENK